MTLLTVKDLEKKYPKITQKELKDFKDSIDNPETNKRYDIFLIHPNLHLKLLYRINKELESLGFSIYLDCCVIQDSDFSTEKEKGLHRIKKIMKNCRCLFLVVLNEKSQSFLCPWKVGYFDCLKGKVAILPVFKKDTNTLVFKGRKFLSIYPYAGFGEIAFEARDTIWLLKDPKNYVDIEYWLGRSFIDF
ncbi:MAG: hypothetical protein AB1798_04355 [Spirochaetota bacterium]